MAKRMTRAYAKRVLSSGTLKGKPISPKQKILFGKFAKGTITRSAHRRKKR